MKQNLRDYVIKQQNFLDKEFCDETIKQLKESENNWQQHTFYNSKTGEAKPWSGNQELDVLHDTNIKNTKQLDKQLWFGLDKYIKHVNLPWHMGWAGYSSVRYNRYSQNRKMAEHCDHIHSLFEGKRKGIPILSCLGVLNNDYEGGEFIMFEDFEIKLEQGDLLIFPSNFLYPHRVEPVKNGVRYSYISWSW
tara:strand:- start:41 stop:616 length:576 start_codon:yes stop_codon:yes gene_type:complete